MKKGNRSPIILSVADFEILNIVKTKNIGITELGRLGSIHSQVALRPHVRRLLNLGLIYHERVNKTNLWLIKLTPAGEETLNLLKTINEYQNRLYWDHSKAGGHHGE